MSPMSKVVKIFNPTAGNNSPIKKNGVEEFNITQIVPDFKVPVKLVSKNKISKSQHRNHNSKPNHPIKVKVKKDQQINDTEKVIKLDAFKV